MMEHLQALSIGVLDVTPQKKADAALHQFLASALTVKAAHEIDPNYQVGMMLAYQPMYAETCDPEDQLFVLKKLQRQFLWYSDVQIGGKYPNHKLKEYEREGIQLNVQEGELELIVLKCIWMMPGML